MTTYSLHQKGCKYSSNFFSGCLLIFLLLAPAMAWTQQLQINNDLPRTDMNGKIVDAHDGRIIQFNNIFYWYGTAYGNTNGFTDKNEYVCYSSKNLKDWKFEGALIPEKPKGVYYRPHVVYNKKTGKYILWYNWYPKLWDGQFGVAQSNSPAGPFTIINNNVQVKHSKLGVGDLGVFVDENQKAYLSYNTISGHRVSVEQLDESYTASTMQGSEFIAENCEAGSMFKRNGLYYLLTDYTCCFCTQGSGARVFTARHPLGPYTFRQNINRYPGDAAPLLHDGYTGDNVFETFEPKQNHAVELWFDKITSLSSINIKQFTGNRSGQCGQVDNPKVHQPVLQHSFIVQYWKDGAWHPLQTEKPIVKNLSMQTFYEIRFKNTTAERLQITPVYSDTTQPLFLSEITVQPGAKKFRIFKTGRQPGKPIIPAQQTYVMQVQTTTGTQLIWMGDLWGSASDNIKGHDYQFWSAPLQFYSNGLIKPLQWVNQYQLTLK